MPDEVKPPLVSVAGLTLQPASLPALLDLIINHLAGDTETRQTVGTHSPASANQQTDQPDDSESSGAGDHKNLLIAYVNPHVVNLAHCHKEVYELLCRADRVCIDGVGVQLAALVFKQRFLPRVVAEHLFDSLVNGAKKLPAAAQETSPESGPRDRPAAVLIGTSSDEVCSAAKKINHSTCTFNIVDTLSGFESDSSYLNFFEKHRQVPLILIGAGTPRSEQIARIADDTLQRATIILIGAGTIKTWAGTKIKGPRLLSRLGLEWCHRLIHEPHTRSRYGIGIVVFLKHVITAGLADRAESRSRQCKC